jgi:hypothetical protein
MDASDFSALPLLYNPDPEGGHPGAVGAGANPGTPGQPCTPSPERETDTKIKNRHQHDQ